MLTPYSWLKDYVKTDICPKELAEKLIMTGNAVENIISAGDNIQNVVVGKITKITKHPDADKLQICQVDIGGGESVQIVTGADNVFEGAIVPAALEGALLPNGTKIKKGKLRGVESLGMLCSGGELMLTEEDYPGAGVYGILILQDGIPGTDIRELLNLNDTIFEFEVGANRPDCLSILGVAREAAATLDIPVEIPKPEYTACGGDVSEYVRVTVAAPDLCPRYMARAVKNVKIAPSPEWIKRRLKAAGVRPISNIVDITNFVMLETGQPMHAFDASDIHGSHIIVRRAGNGERMTTLDGKEREFTDSTLLITDEAGPIGIAGIMGGENSEIKDSTTTVVFESAKFMYGNIRKSSRALGMSTESSMRFSKGIDAATAEFAINRACQLVELLGAGEVVGGTIDILAEELSPRFVTATAEHINELLGTDIAKSEMISILNRVSIPTTAENGALTCEIPYYRGDIAGQADIAEEIARIYGYDNIPMTPMRLSIRKGDPSFLERAEDRLTAALADMGFFETIAYSFMSEADCDKLLMPADARARDAVAIKNPLGNDSGYMRTTMLPGLLNCVATNLNRKNDSLKLFEIGRVFITQKEDAEKTSVGEISAAIDSALASGVDVHKKLNATLKLSASALPTEYKHIAFAVVGDDEDFYTLKGYIENTAAVLGSGELSFTAGGPDCLHSGRKALISCEGAALGYMGELHPAVMENYGIAKRIYVAELGIEAIAAKLDRLVTMKPLPKYPAAERDLAIVVESNVESGAIRSAILKNGGKSIESAELFDVYTGLKLAGKKSLAYSLRFRAADRTLTDDEVASAMHKIMRALERDFGAELRA